MIHIDARGKLAAYNLQFYAVRAFVITEVGPDVTRGHHAHRRCHQQLICLDGELYVWIEDKSGQRTNYLNQRMPSLYLPPLTWSFLFGFAPNTILLVLASHPYDRGDYIEDYQDYLRYIKDCDDYIEDYKDYLRYIK